MRQDLKIALKFGALMFNDNRCNMDWMGLVVEYELNGTNHYEALIPNGSGMIKMELMF